MSIQNLEHGRSLMRGAAQEPPPPAAEVHVIDMRGLFSAIWRRRRSIVAFAAAFAVAAALIALAIPSRYNAVAQLLVDPAGLNVLSDDVTRTPSNADAALAEAESQIGVVRSSNVLQEVVRRAKLTEDTEFGAPANGLLSSLTAWMRPPADMETAERLALRILEESILVTRQEMGFVINVDVWTQSPAKSAMIANTIAEVYLEKNRAARSDMVRRSSEALGARLEDLRTRANESAARVEAYRREKGLVDAGGVMVIDQQLQEATNELSKVNASLEDLETRYQEILDMRAKEISPDALSEALLSPTIAQLRSLLTVALAQVSTLEATLGPGHPELQAARSNVAQVKGQIQAELDRIVEATRIERDRARARQKALAARVESLKSDVLGSNTAMLGLKELTRQADSDREVYEAFLKRAGELSERQGVDTTSARLISRATPPLKKDWPPRMLIVLAAGMLGLAVGVGQALLREQFDPRIHSATQIAQEVGVPALAELPRELLAGQGDGKDASAEIRRLYNRVAATPGAGTSWVLLTSADAGKMPALTALTLASAAVESGDRVMMIDADTEEMRLTRLFGLGEAAGLRDLLYRGDNFTSVHQIGEEDQLWLMPAGKPEPAGGRDRSWPLRKSVNERNQPVDLVLVNAGRIWSSRLHRSVVASADAVILVAERYETRSADLARTVEELNAAGAQVGGVLLIV